MSVVFEYIEEHLKHLRSILINLLTNGQECVGVLAAQKENCEIAFLRETFPGVESFSKNKKSSSGCHISGLPSKRNPSDGAHPETHLVQFHDMMWCGRHHAGSYLMR